MKIDEIRALPDNVVFFGYDYYLVNNELYEDGKKVKTKSKKEYLAETIDSIVQDILKQEEQLSKINASIEKLEKVVNNKELYQKMHDYIANGYINKDFVIPKPFKNIDGSIVLSTPYGTYYYTYRFDIISDLDILKWRKIELEQNVKKLKEKLC